MLQQFFCNETNILSPLVNKRIKSLPHDFASHDVSLRLLPLSQSTSILDSATFNALARYSVFCINSGMLNNSSAEKSKERTLSQSDESSKSLHFTALLSKRYRKLHIWPHRKNPWSRLGSDNLLNVSQCSWIIALNFSKRASKKKECHQ